MDEFQFIESLDSLLSNEVIDEAQTGTINTNNNTPVHGQGILSGPVSWGSTDWLPRTDVNAGTGNSSITNVEPFGSFRAPAAQVSNDHPTDQRQSQMVTSYPSHPFTATMIDNNCTTQTKAHVTVQQARPRLDTISPSTITNVPVTARRGIKHRGGHSNPYSGGGDGDSASVSVRSVGSGTTTGSAGTGTTSSRKRSRKRSSTEVSESEDDNTRRRYDRNRREQRRSQKITEQIDELRDVLAAASIRFKPDKFSTLISVVDYVKQLQARSTMLDMEHKKLIDTISRTNEMVNESYLPSSAGGGGGGGSIFSNDKIGSDLFLTAQPDSTVSSSGRHDIYNDDELVFVRNVDYRCIFDRCGMPLAVASIDGRLLDCNEEFVKLTGYEHKELLPNKHQKQQTSAPIIADHVASTSSAYPDVPVSHSDSSISTATNSITEGKRSPPEQDHNSVQDDNIVDDETVDENQAPAINFSLFDLLNRNHMEEVFMSLSEMLKRPPREKVGPEAIIVDDHWWGNVYLNRSSQVEVRLSRITLVANTNLSKVFLPPRKRKLTTRFVFLLLHAVIFLSFFSSKMRMTISLVRSPQGRAKFFDCSLTPLAV